MAAIRRLSGVERAGALLALLRPQGKNFRKEMTKAKRGTYMGGVQPLSACVILAHVASSAMPGGSAKSPTFVLHPTFAANALVVTPAASIQSRPPPRFWQAIDTGAVNSVKFEYD